MYSAHFLTPTALVVFFLSCTPRGEAGTSPFEVLSSSRRAPSHSSLWSLSTLKAWPRFVYDTAGGTDGPTRRDAHTNKRDWTYLCLTKRVVISTPPTFKAFRRKRTDEDSIKQSQSKPGFIHHRIFQRQHRVIQIQKPR